jgi:protein Mpv17
MATQPKAPLELDARRTASAAVWRAAIFTPPAHFFYIFLDRAVKMPSTGPLRRFRWWAALSLIDGLLWLPPVFASYFATRTLLRGGTIDDAVAKVKTSLIPALKFSLCFWPPMHIVTFFFVPLHQRLLFVNMASIAVAFSLSYIDYSTVDDDDDDDDDDINNSSSHIDFSPAHDDDVKANDNSTYGGENKSSSSHTDCSSVHNDCSLVHNDDDDGDGGDGSVAEASVISVDVGSVDGNEHILKIKKL